MVAMSARENTELYGLPDPEHHADNDQHIGDYVANPRPNVVHQNNPPLVRLPSSHAPMGIS